MGKARRCLGANSQVAIIDKTFEDPGGRKIRLLSTEAIE